MLNQGLGHAQYLTAVTISTQQVNIWSSEPTSVLFSVMFFFLFTKKNIYIIVQGWTQAESLCLEGSTGLDTRATGASIYKKY